MRLLPFAALLFATTAQAAEPVTMDVHRDANCGCCKSWIEHLRKHSFTVIARDTSDLSGIKRTARLPELLGSCHTGFVNGYVSAARPARLATRIRERVVMPPI